MDNRPCSVELVAATDDEMAAWLSANKCREVSIQEVRRIEAQALRKLRHELMQRGLSPADLLPEW